MDRASAFTVDPAKVFLTSSLINVQNLLLVSHAVCARVGGPKNLGDTGALHLGWWVWLTPKKHARIPHGLLPISDPS